MQIINDLESEVRGYVRAFPTVFATAKGAKITNEDGKEYTDFFAGAGTLNYGHNNPYVKKALLDYLNNDGIMHALDMATSAKIAFLESLEQNILLPRGLDYKVQFTGPTGTNSVESALKLARKIKNRSNIVAFTNAFHGLSAGSLAVTANSFYRDESHINRSNVSFMPFDGYFDFDSIEYFKKIIKDNSSGLDLPAAVIVETIQAEGGINVASDEWLQKLAKLCQENDILLIIDDIQAGNGRSGDFFSFEQAGIKPDMVTLSKSIGGGLPLALLFIRSDLDIWEAGEHTGTFRGNNLAFVAAKELLDHYWKDDSFSKSIKEKEQILKARLTDIAEKNSDLGIKVRGRGLLYGIEINPEFAKKVSKECFKNGLIIELSGSEDQVVKFLPPLIIEKEDLNRGLDIVENAIKTVKGAEK